jgi:hypothetical protein
LEELRIELYRAISTEELQDIKACGQFRQHPDGRSMEAKWFLKSFEDAKKFGKLFYFNRNINVFYIVKASIPSNVEKIMFHDRNIDYIGEGVAIDEEFLDQLKPLNSWKIKRQKNNV